MTVPLHDQAPEQGGGHPINHDRDMARVYMAVVLVEAGVLLGLWALGRYFGS